MEICVDSIESARNAVRGGASRLEACAALSEGGLTPSPGLVRFIKAHNSKVPVYAMIRARSGNFVYTREEVDAMIYDMSVLKDAGADGFVFGALTDEDKVDKDFCREIVAAARPRRVTFHRAFDEAREPFEALEEIISLGFERILTSGQRNRAIEGLELIRELVIKAGDRISIMPGSGITPENLSTIKTTGAKEFHASAKVRVSQNEKTNRVKIGDKVESSVAVVDAQLVRQMVEIVYIS